MRDRMRKTIITLLVVIAMMIGIMLFADREVNAATTQVVWEGNTIKDIELIAASPEPVSYTDEDGVITITAVGISGTEYSLLLAGT